MSAAQEDVEGHPAAGRRRGDANELMMEVKQPHGASRRCSMRLLRKSPSERLSLGQSDAREGQLERQE